MAGNDPPSMARTRQRRAGGLASARFVATLAPLLFPLCFSACGSDDVALHPVAPAREIGSAASDSRGAAAATSLGSPCEGVTVAVESIEPSDAVLEAQLSIDWPNGLPGSFDWTGPYYDFDPQNEVSGERPPELEVNLADWRTDPVPGATRHSIRFQWPPFEQIALRFRSPPIACDLPTLVCAAAGCELRPGAE